MAKKNPVMTKEQLALLADAADYGESIGLSFKQIEAIQDRIIKGQIKTSEQYLKALAQQEKMIASKKGEEILADKILKKEEKKKEVLKITKDLGADMLQMSKDILGEEGKLFKLTSNEVDQQKDLVAAKIEQIKKTRENLDGRSKESKVLKAQLSAFEEMEYQLQRQSDLIGTDKYQAMQKGFNVANEAAEELGDKLQSAFDKIPGGGFLAKAMGLDDAKKKLTDGVVAGFRAMNAEMLKGGSSMSVLKAGAKGLNSILMVNPFILMAAAAAGLFAMMSQLEKKAQEFSKSTGLDVAQSKQLIKETEERGLSLDNNLAKNEDILAVQEEMIKNMGIAGRMSIEQAASVANTAKMFGYAASEAAGVQTSFETLGATTEEAANMQKKLGLEAFKSGVNVGAVMKDIAENSEDAMRYIGGGAEEMAKAALEGAKLGMDLKQMTKISDKLLDIESSLTAQYEFQALSGKEINLDKARELALNGDIVGAAKAVTDEIGSAAEFNKMNRFEKEKLAEATGMEVGELAKTLTLQEKLGDLSEEQAAAAASLNMSAEEMAKMSDEDLAAAIEKQQSTEKASKAFQDIVNTLKSALMPLAEGVAQIIGTIAPYLKMAFYPVQKIGEGIRFITEQFGFMKPVIGAIAAILLVKYIRGKLRAKQQQKEMANTIKQADYERAVAELAERRAKAEGRTASSIKDQTKNLLANKKASQGGGKGMLGKAKGMLKGGLGKAKGMLTSPMGMLAAGMGTVGMIGGMFGNEGEENAAGIPGFATGGVVGSTGIAKVHAGEEITPASKVPGSEPKGDGGGGGIDYDKMTQAFIAALQQMPAPQVNMDGAKISESVSANQSYDRGIK